MKRIINILFIILLSLSSCNENNRCKIYKVANQELREKNEKLQFKIDSLQLVCDSLLNYINNNPIDTIHIPIYDTIPVIKDSIVYNIIDSVIYDTTYIDSIIFDTISTYMYIPPDTLLFKFIDETALFNPKYMIRPVIDWFTLPYNKQLQGQTRIRNRSNIDYISDSTVYMEIILYDSTITNILYSDKIYIPDIKANEEFNIDYNSGDFIAPYRGSYIFRRVFYVKHGEDIAPIRGFYSLYRTRMK